MLGSSVIGALRVNLGIDSAAFSEGLKRTESSLQKFGKRMQSIGASLSTRITAPIAAVGTALGAGVTAMAGQVDEMRKLAQISNVGFEEFQKLAFASRSVGIEGEKLADIFKDMNDRVGDFMATGGGPMADFVENIAPKVGITADAFRNLSGPQALQLYYDSLVKAGASQQDMTFYLEAMASDATALIPLLRDGGAAFRELGEGAAVMSEQDAASLKAYNDAVRGLMESLRGLTMAIASSGFVEWATGVVQKVTEWVNVLRETNPELLKWGTIVAGLAAAIGPVVVGVGLLATGIAAIGVPVAAAIAGIAALTAGVIAFWPEISKLAAAISTFLADGWARFAAAWDGMVAKVAAVEQAGGQFAENLLRAFLALPGQMMEIGSQIIQGLWDGLASKMGQVKDYLASSVSGMVDSVKGVLGIRSPSRVMQEVGVNVMQGLQDGMGSMAGNIESLASSIGSTIASAFEGVINGSKSVKEALTDVLKSLASMLLNRAFQSLFGAGGFIGSLFGGLVGFAGGGSFKVGGSGGIDSQLVAFKASPNETVSVTKPGQERGGGTYAPVYNIDARGADQAAIDRLERGLAERDRQFGKMVDARNKTAQIRKARA